MRLGKTDFIEDPAALERDLPGSRIAACRAARKILVVELEASNGRHGNFSLLIHLGMTGQIVVGPPEAPVAPHTHAFFALDDGREFRYTDIRRFGKMRISSAVTQRRPLSASSASIHWKRRRASFSRNSGAAARIKAFLLDQRVLRGMGNIYTDESLWRARIHPMRLGAKSKKTNCAASIAPCAKCLKKRSACAVRRSRITWTPKDVRQISAAASRLSAQGEEMLSRRWTDPPHDRRRAQQLFLPALPARAAHSPPCPALSANRASVPDNQLFRS